MRQYLVLFLLIALLKPISSSAANFYVSKNGSGVDGTSWTTAWRELNNIVWGVVNPGDTIYIDGGQVACPSLGSGANCGMVYNSTLSVQKSGTSTAPITIKMSTEPNHNGGVIIDGGLTQWSRCAEYAPEPAPISTPNGQGLRDIGINLNNSQWIIIDGTKWGGIEIRNHTRYGVNFSGSKYSRVSYTKIHHNTDPTDTTNGAVGVTQNYESLNNTLSRSEIYRNGQDAVRGAGDFFTLEENYIHDHYCNHPDGFQAFIPNGNAGMENVSGLITNVTIRRNIFERVGLQPVFLGENNIIQDPINGHDSWVENTLIENNLMIDGHDMIKTKNGKTKNVTVRNNTLYHSTGWAVEWCCASPPAIPPMTITNNIFYDTPDQTDPDRNSSFGLGGVSTTFTNNCMYSLPTSGIPSGTGNLTTNPQFVNPAGGDYSLSPSSPCIGRGANITSVSQLLALSGSVTPTITPTISPTPSLTASDSWTWMADLGLITSPFSITQGNPTYVSQTVQTLDPAFAGKAEYAFSLQTSGKYLVRVSVNAPNTSSDSLFASIDSSPSLTDIWDVGVTSGFQTKLLQVRGSGTVDSPQYKPKVYDLAAGRHTLIIQGREAGAQFSQAWVSRLGDANLDGSVNITDIRQSLLDYSRTNLTSDMNADNKTSIFDTMFSF